MYPGYEVAAAETVEVDVCEDTTFTNTTEVIMDEPSNVIPCTDTANSSTGENNVITRYPIRSLSFPYIPDQFLNSLGVGAGIGHNV